MSETKTRSQVTREWLATHTPDEIWEATKGFADLDLNESDFRLTATISVPGGNEIILGIQSPGFGEPDDIDDSTEF